MTDPIKASDTPAIESGAADAPTEIDEAEQRMLSARARAYRRARTVSVIGTFVILAFGCFYIAQSLILPVILAFLLALVFSPVVRTLARYRIPQSLTALAIVLTLTASVLAGIYGLSEPVSKWIDDAP